MARNSLHRSAVVLRLSSLQVLDGVTVTLEERTRAELLSADPSVRFGHIMQTLIEILTNQRGQVCSVSFPPGEKITLYLIFIKLFIL